MLAAEKAKSHEMGLNRARWQSWWFGCSPFLGRDKRAYMWLPQSTRCRHPRAELHSTSWIALPQGLWQRRSRALKRRNISPFIRSPRSSGCGFNPCLGPILIDSKIFWELLQIFVINVHGLHAGVQLNCYKN